MTAVRKMWSSHTTGELQPRPGRSSFQTTFSVSLHRSGNAGLSGIEPARRPRNCGHCSAQGAATTLKKKITAQIVRFIDVMPMILPNRRRALVEDYSPFRTAGAEIPD